MTDPTKMQQVAIKLTPSELRMIYYALGDKAHAKYEASNAPDVTAQRKVYLELEGKDLCRLTDKVHRHIRDDALARTDKLQRVAINKPSTGA